MDKHQVLIIIPARYASSRFPGKPLADLGGKPIIQHVVERAQSAGARVVVATDNDKIARCVHSFGGEVAMTGSHHRSGTERCIEAYSLQGRGEQYVVNLQGDEPFVQPEQIHLLLSALEESQAPIATLAERLGAETTDAEVVNPNIVKLVRDTHGNALYFSRSLIPYPRGIAQGYCQHYPYLRHVGLYGFRAEVLPELATLMSSALEETESLEQLRWLASGYTIAVRETAVSTIGIDTPEDLERARQYLLTHH